MRKKKIPVCPAHVFHYLAKDNDSNYCGEINCCYHCTKWKKCDNNGCSKGICYDGKPDKCTSYPMTFQECEKIYTFACILTKQFDYIKYYYAVKEYMKIRGKTNGC